MSSLKEFSKGPWIFFLITLSWSWLFWIPITFSNEGSYTMPNLVLFALGGLGPTIGALISLHLNNNRDEKMNYLNRLINIKRLTFRWFLLIIFLPPLVSFLAIFLNLAITGTIPDFETTKTFLANPLNLIIFVVMTFVVGPLPEELGWRGLALERLQKEWNAFISTLIVAFFWIAWHLPLFFMEGTYQKEELVFGSLRFWLNYCIGLIATSVIMTWIFNHTKHSILGAIFYHFMGNFIGEFLNLPQTLEYYRALIDIAIAIGIILYYGPKTLAKDVKELELPG